MTMPVEPDTGTPAPDTGDPSQQPTPTDDAAQQPAGQPDTGGWDELIEQWKSDGLAPGQIAERLAASRKHEGRAKRYKQQLDKLNGGGQSPAEPEGSEDWQAKYEAEQERASTFESELLETRYENAVNRAATNVGADAEALLDSQAFRDAVAAELDEDFDTDDLREAVNKVAKDFAKKPRFAAQQPAAGRSGGDFTGGPGARASIDQQIADAEKNRDFATAIALKRQRAALK
ncbi:cysteine--tRNA ligase [Actinomadura montaniterrae]|uniref:Scaffolding protein n=1 Tax=Actinomadura montaniterrae TaxID=1803903 RepID=A0A6L3VX95_9ACTN|nr:hypothetical protein [Actinomadura montaniterrae]KAB2384751.1 hypothetical protein F9B16_09900 [Actinomadura montaniterrae]